MEVKKAESLPEIFSQVNLKIISPELDKHFMVAFESANKRICEVYNYAINKVLTEENLRPFHQVGHGEAIGYNAWEIWNDVDQRKLEELLDKIHACAKSDFNESDF